LNRTRSQGEQLDDPISVAEMNSYAQLFHIKDEEIPLFFNAIRAMDEVSMTHAVENLKRKQKEMKKQNGRSRSKVSS
jgi:hypothetical protein